MLKCDITIQQKREIIMGGCVNISGGTVHLSWPMKLLCWLVVAYLHIYSPGTHFLTIQSASQQICNGMGYRQLNATVFAISHRFYLFIYLIPLGFDATFLHGLTWLCICSPSLSVIVSCSFDHFLFWPHVYFPTMHILFGSNYSNCIYRHTHGYLQAMFMCYTPTWMPLGEYL